MNLLVDESVDRNIVERLRYDGHDVVYVADLSPGVTDNEVLQKANESGTLLLTADKDFGELVFRQRRVHAGVALIRLAGLSAVVKAEMVAKVFQDRCPELCGAFSVISPGAVRVRREP